MRVRPADGKVQNAYKPHDATALTVLLIVNRVAVSAVSAETRLAKMENEEKTSSLTNR